jgi:hypothetical protein
MLGVLNTRIKEMLGESKVVAEKAVSKAQRKAAGIALAAKKAGKAPKKGTASAELAKMNTKELEKFAKTKEKGLPQKVKEAAKPDFLDVDKDGNKKETFKKAVADKKKNPFKKTSEGAKPDFLDLDKDGNKKEPMKKAAKDKEENVEEGKEKCEECGGMWEEGHSCEEGAEKLDEWANTSQGKSHDQFITDIDFMTKVISGGLNNMKQDQTTLPSTRVRTQSEQMSPATSLAELMRKLGDIK